MFSIFKEFRIFFLYFFLSILLLFPQFYTTHPTLIDDGTDLLTVKQMSYTALLQNELRFSERNRPLRMIYRKAFYSLFGTRLSYYFFVNALVLSATCYLLNYFLLIYNFSKYLAIPSSIFFMTLPSVAENYYRLGTDEPLQVLFLLIALITLIKNRHGLSIAIFSALLFIKETSIFFLIIPLIYFALNKKSKSFALTAFIGVIFSICMIWKIRTSTDVYIHQAMFNFKNIHLAYAISPILFYLLASIPLWFFIWRKKRYIPPDYVIIIALLVQSIFPLAIWKMDTFYYYLPTQTSTLIYGVLTAHFCCVEFRISKRATLIVLNAMLIIISAIYLPISLDTMKAGHYRHITEGALVSYILDHNLSGYSVYSAEEIFEKADKIYLYTTQWKTNNITPIFFPKPETLNKAKETSQEALSIVANESYQLFDQDINPKSLLISPRKIHSNYHEEPICGIDFFMGKVCQYYVYSK